MSKQTFAATNVFAASDRLKHADRDRLREEAGHELDGLPVHPYVGDGEPDYVLPHLDAGQVGDPTVGQLPGDGPVVIEEIGELDIALVGLEADLEGAVAGKGVGLDGVRH